MISVFSWQNSISLCPASFRTPRPNFPVTLCVSWLPAFAFQSHIMKRTSLIGQRQMKKETMGFRMGTCTLGGSQEEGKVFTHSENLSQLGTLGNFGTSESNAETGTTEAKQKINHRDYCQTAVPSTEASCNPAPTESGIGCSDSDFRIRPQGVKWDWLPWQYLKG